MAQQPLIAADLVQEVRLHGIRMVAGDDKLHLTGKAPFPVDLMARLRAV